MAKDLCVLVELKDGSLRGYEYVDAEIAAAVQRECHARWQAGRPLVFKLRGQVLGASRDVFDAADVADVSLASCEAARAAGAWTRTAFALESV